MGQKIHPEGFRVGYIHDWKSQLVQRARLLRLPDGGHRDPRPHRGQALARRPLGHHDQEGPGEIEVDIPPRAPAS